MLLAATAALARIPRGAWPRPPNWFWIALLVSGGLASLAGRSPHLTVAGTVLGFGGLDAYCRFVAVGVALLLAAALVGWTTPLGEIAPAVSQLLAPLRLVRVPVDEAAVAVALWVRSLPLLVDEVRTLVAARRLRPAPPRRPGHGALQHWLDELVDLLVAALAVSMRRAGELAEAITARGGTGLIAARTSRPRLADGVALLVVAAVLCRGGHRVWLPELGESGRPAVRAGSRAGPDLPDIGWFASGSGQQLGKGRRKDRVRRSPGRPHHRVGGQGPDRPGPADRPRGRPG